MNTQLIRQLIDAGKIHYDIVNEMPDDDWHDMTKRRKWLYHAKMFEYIYGAVVALDETQKGHGFNEIFDAIDKRARKTTKYDWTAT